MSELKRKLEELSYKFYATIIEVHDGDTIKVDVDLGFNVFTHISIRVQGLYCKELYTGSDSDKAEGKAARDYLKTLLPVGSEVVIHTDKYRQSFTRFVGEIFLPDGRNIADIMISSGHGTSTP